MVCVYDGIYNGLCLWRHLHGYSSQVKTWMGNWKWSRGRGCPIFEKHCLEKDVGSKKTSQCQAERPSFVNLKMHKWDFFPPDFIKHIEKQSFSWQNRLLYLSTAATQWGMLSKVRTAKPELTQLCIHGLPLLANGTEALPSSSNNNCKAILNSIFLTYLQSRKGRQIGEEFRVIQFSFMSLFFCFVLAFALTP